MLVATNYLRSMAWWQEAVFYQIYPRSFCDFNGDGVGDLEGVTSRLDYLAELGVDALWLSPIFPSPMRDFGYDVADYCDVDALFGDLQAFDRLMEQAHQRNIKVILDWVPNHTSSDHPWFQESRSSLTNEKRNWYVWRSLDEQGNLPNNWIRAWSDQPAWTLDASTAQFYLHCFLEGQPDLNWDEPAVRHAMHDVLRFWLERGVDGFRMDVVHLIGKELDRNDDPELAGLTHVILNDVPVVHEYLREIRSVLDEFDDRVSVGEVALFDPQQVATYYGSGDELHLSFNFKSLMTPWRAQSWSDLITETESTHQWVGAWPTWVLSNHDNPRVATRLGENERRVRAAMVLLLTLRGTPFLYAGEELGLPDAFIPPDRVVDPGGRDGCRAPIPWDDSPHHGWTEHPWLPFIESASKWSVATQQSQDDSMWWFTKSLLSIRHAHGALRHGQISNLRVDGNLLSFERMSAEETIGVAVNFGETPVPSPWQSRQPVPIFPVPTVTDVDGNSAIIVALGN